MEGFSVSHTQAIRLILLALQRDEYGLVGDLLRFIMPPSEGGGAVQWDEYGLVGDLLRVIMPPSEEGVGHFMPQHVSTSGPGWTALGDVFCPLFLPSKPGPTLLSFVAKGACPRASNVPALTPLPRNLQARWMSLAPNPSGSDSTRRQPAGAVLPS